MAPTLQAIILLMVICTAITSARDFKNYKEKPVVLVLDEAAKNELNDNKYSHMSSSSEEEQLPYHYMQKLYRLVQSYKKRGQYRKPSHDAYHDLHRHVKDRYSVHSHKERASHDMVKSQKQQDGVDRHSHHNYFTNNEHLYDNRDTPKHHHRDRNINKDLQKDDFDKHNGRQQYQSAQNRLQYRHNQKYHSQKHRALYGLDRTTQGREIYRYRDDREQTHRGLDREDKQHQQDKLILRSPIVKSLLRIADDLQCGAQTECKQDCNNLNNRDECIDECHNNYECNTDKQDDNTCDEENDECGSTEEHKEEGSTKGAFYVTEKYECKRCKK